MDLLSLTTMTQEQVQQLTQAGKEMAQKVEEDSQQVCAFVEGVVEDSQLLGEERAQVSLQSAIREMVKIKSSMSPETEGGDTKRVTGSRL